MVYSDASMRHLCNIYKSLRKLWFILGGMAINRVFLLLCGIFDAKAGLLRYRFSFPQGKSVPKGEN